MELRPTTTKSCGFNLIKIPIENQQSVSSAVDVEQDRILDIIRLVIQGIPDTSFSFTTSSLYHHPSPPSSCVRENQPCRAVKFYLVATCDMRKEVDSEDTIRHWFSSQPTEVLESTHLTLTPHVNHIENKIDEYVRKGTYHQALLLLYYLPI